MMGSPVTDEQVDRAQARMDAVSGMDVLEAIQKVETDENDRPLTDIRMLRVYRKAE